MIQPAPGSPQPPFQGAPANKGLGLLGMDGLRQRAFGMIPSGQPGEVPMTTPTMPPGAATGMPVQPFAGGSGAPGGLFGQRQFMPPNAGATAMGAPPALPAAPAMAMPMPAAMPDNPVPTAAPPNAAMMSSANPKMAAMLLGMGGGWSG